MKYKDKVFEMKIKNGRRRLNMNVKLARIKANLTQMQLCKIVKISSRKIVAAEKGNCDNLTLANMKAISKALNSDVIELFFSQE